MKFLNMLVVVLLSFFTLDFASADILGAECAPLEITQSGQWGAQGLSCNSLKSYTEAWEITKMVISPMALIFLGTGARELIIAEMAAAGMTLANPVVLTVAGVSAGVAVTMHIWIRKSLEECARMEQEELRQTILRELEIKYGAHSAGQESLEVRNY